jgi:hypothetical protein
MEVLGAPAVDYAAGASDSPASFALTVASDRDAIIAAW